VCTNISVLVRGADALYEEIAAPPARTGRSRAPLSNASRLRLAPIGLGRHPVVLRPASQGRRERLVEDLRAGTRSRCRSAASPLRRTAASELPASMSSDAGALSKDIDEPNLADIAVYDARGWLKAAAKVLSMSQDAVLSGSMPPGLRGRGVAQASGGTQASFLPRATGQVLVCTRRVRARHLQGSEADAEVPAAAADRGHR